jgi:FkbM family methyltransferase
MSPDRPAAGEIGERDLDTDLSKSPTGDGVVGLPGGIFATISDSEARHLWTEICVQRAYRHLAFRYEPGSTIIDVGANIGIFGRWALQETGGCRLIAIEPAAQLFGCLERNLAEVETQVDLLQTGCGAEDVDEATFWYFPQVPSMSSFAPDRARDTLLLGGLLANDPAWSGSDGGLKHGRFLEAAFESLPQIARRRRISTIFKELKIGYVDLLKIDVQRGEQEILQGIESEDWKHISQVVVELQDHAGALEKTISILGGVGFTVDVGSIALHRGTDVKFVYGWRT